MTRRLVAITDVELLPCYRCGPVSNPPIARVPQSPDTVLFKCSECRISGPREWSDGAATEGWNRIQRALEAFDAIAAKEPS